MRVPTSRDHRKVYDFCMQNRRKNTTRACSFDSLPVPLVCIKLRENEWEDVNSRASNT